MAFTDKRWVGASSTAFQHPTRTNHRLRQHVIWGRPSKSALVAISPQRLVNSRVMVNGICPGNWEKYVPLEVDAKRSGYWMKLKAQTRSTLLLIWISVIVSSSVSNGARGKYSEVITGIALLILHTITPPYVLDSLRLLFANMYLLHFKCPLLWLWMKLGTIDSKGTRETFSNAMKPLSIHFTCTPWLGIGGNFGSFEW